MRSRQATLKYNLKVLGGFYLALNIWAVKKRAEWYMEHSFDILSPNIGYLETRY
jgi:hypothetical protein